MTCSPSKSTLETGTTALTGLHCFAFVIINDAVFTTLTGMSGDALTAISFKAGTLVEGNFTAITLASGAIVIYEM